MNAFRFSVEWSRIQPEEGAWNAEAVRHYKDYIAAMKKRGLEPVMTLFHFTLPIWFARKGGFERRANVRYFVEFVDRILEELGPSVRYIITINEPETYTYQSYITGEWPPQRHKKLLALRVYRNLALAHNHAARVIHQKSRKHKVSVAKNSMFVYPGDDAWLSRVSASVGQFIQDDYFLRQVYKTCDFLGVNYYMDARIYGYRMHNPKLAQKKESHEQWTVSAPYGKIRVRKTTLPELAPTFEVTVKTRDSKMGISDGNEDNLPCEEGFFESFKAIASDGMIKDRFEFKASRVTVKTESGEQDIDASDDVVFEVDGSAPYRGLHYRPQEDNDLGEILDRYGPEDDEEDEDDEDEDDEADE
jgi:hypothetical protein